MLSTLLSITPASSLELDLIPLRQPLPHPNRGLGPRGHSSSSARSSPAQRRRAIPSALVPARPPLQTTKLGQSSVSRTTFKVSGHEVCYHGRRHALAFLVRMHAIALHVGQFRFEPAEDAFVVHPIEMPFGRG